MTNFKLGQPIITHSPTIECLKNLLQVRSFGVNFYVLRDSDGLYVIDGGFVGGRYLLRRALKMRGWYSERIAGIVVTHGHLDHILNVGRIAEETGAWIAAPRLDAPHYDGCPVYKGAAKLLFSADLFASYGVRSHLPPLIFNDNECEIPKSVAKALEHDLVGVLPNHGDRSSPEVHLERLTAILS